MMNCKVDGTPMKISSAYRIANGDIIAKYHCFKTGSGSQNTQKKITHDTCKKNSTVIYKNGEGYNLTSPIQADKHYPNLIGCWCNKYLRFKNEDELVKHVEGNSHPE